MNIPAWLDVLLSAVVFLALTVEIYDIYRLREKLRKMSKEAMQHQRNSTFWSNAFTARSREANQMRDRLVQKNKRLRGVIDRERVSYEKVIMDLEFLMHEKGETK